MKKAFFISIAILCFSSLLFAQASNLERHFKSGQMPAKWLSLNLNTGFSNFEDGVSYSYCIDDAPPIDAYRTSYKNELSNKFNWGIGIEAIFSSIGICLDYSRTNDDFPEKTLTYQLDYIEIVTQSVKSDWTINMVSLTLSYYHKGFNIGVGPLVVRQQMNVDFRDSSVTGDSRYSSDISRDMPGLNLSFGYDYRLSRNFALGLKASYKYIDEEDDAAVFPNIGPGISREHDLDHYSVVLSIKAIMPLIE